jgi:hypothetical protein
MLFHMVGAFAEFERGTHPRTHQGRHGRSCKNEASSFQQALRNEQEDGAEAIRLWHQRYDDQNRHCTHVRRSPKQRQTCN